MEVRFLYWVGILELNIDNNNNMNNLENFDRFAFEEQRDTAFLFRLKTKDWSKRG